MMQLFYLKNLAGASAVAILFSVISLRTIGGQEPHMDNKSDPSLALSEKSPEAPLPMSEEMKPNMDESNIDEGFIDEIYQEIEKDKTQGVETPNAPAETRALERLQQLKERDALTAEEPHSDLSELHQRDEVSLGKTENTMQESMQETSVPQAAIPSASPASFGSAKPKVIGKSTAWDDKDNPEPQPEEDPSDPTSEGQGPGGKHKMGRMRPTGPVIPIIRMGENLKDNRGFTVIKPWNS